MTYLSRPVLEIKPNWVRTPASECYYDLRGIRIGFGSATFDPSANFVARGWANEFTFDNADDFNSFSTFIAGRSGKLDGFWFPNQALQCEVVSGSSATVFDILTQNLVGTWADDPCAHLYAIKPDGTTVAVEIDSVATVSSTVERITVATTLGSTPTTAWKFYRLLYVRLVDDEERVQLHSEGTYTQSVKVVELPEDYTDAETGLTPAYLYDFWQDNGDGTFYHWRYTSFSTDIVSGGDTFIAYNINHGELSKSTRAERTEIKIKTVYKDGTPWALLLPFPATRPINLIVYECDATAPNNRTLYFSGEYSDIEADGQEIEISFDHWFESMRKQYPGRVVQPRCHYHLGDAGTCKVDLSSFVDPNFVLTVSITLIDDFEVSVTHAKFTAHPSHYPVNFFADGLIRTGVEPAIEERRVVASSAASGGGVVLVVSQKIIHQTTPIAATLSRGCDQLYETCDTVFGNVIHYPGFVDVPRTNPTIKAIEVAGGSSGKK